MSDFRTLVESGELHRSDRVGSDSGTRGSASDSRDRRRKKVRLPEAGDAKGAKDLSYNWEFCLGIEAFWRDLSAQAPLRSCLHAVLGRLNSVEAQIHHRLTAVMRRVIEYQL